jgi:hypothetical protein
MPSTAPAWGALDVMPVAYVLHDLCAATNLEDAVHCAD